MNLGGSQEVEAKVWENLDYGVLPIYSCKEERRTLGDRVALHFSESRYLRLLRIAKATKIHCFIYFNSPVYPQFDMDAYICTINTINGSTILGFITNTVKINQAWIDPNDKLWWCRFQVVSINSIRPIRQTDSRSNFKCTRRNNDSFPVLTFWNRDVLAEDKKCELYYNDSWHIRMYSCKCTLAMKQAVTRAAKNTNDPEYDSLHKLPRATVWYILPDRDQRGVNCKTLVKYMLAATQKVTGSTTRNDIISMLVNLEVSCVNQISVDNAKAEIQFVHERMVRNSMSRRPARPSFITKVNFGITKGIFLPQDVSLTPAATSRIYKEISLKVNEGRLGLLYDGHNCTNSPLKRLPLTIVEKIKYFLIYM